MSGESPKPQPLPRVSAKHYAKAGEDTASRAAKVRFREVGKTDGHVYQGQVIVIPCRTCGT
jgi:hypothetical protein